MAKRRNITIITGSRAEFGLLKPLMSAVVADKRLRLRTIVTGVHLTTKTWRDVAEADFKIEAKVPMQHATDTGRAADVAALGYGITGLGAALVRLRPDMVVVLGDRIEALAGACAASIGGDYLVHIHGGDRAGGVADEAMRHAISKLAHLHFTATTTSRRRLIRMGEDPRWVFNVGSLAIDGLAAIPPQPGAPEPYIIIMQHPIGASVTQEKAWMEATLNATQHIERIVFAPNRDPGWQGICQAIKAVGIEPIAHMPRTDFMGMLKAAAALVGNSSAGLIEAAAIRPGGVPVVNIGSRQAGREQLSHVMNCGYGKGVVRTSVKKALALPGLSRGRYLHHPFGDGKTAGRIARHLATVPLNRAILRKLNTY